MPHDFPYLYESVLLARDTENDMDEVREAQRHLRMLGYLHRGIDGAFGDGTRLAVMGFQHDLIHGAPRKSGGNPPVDITEYRNGRRIMITGEIDYDLALCLADAVRDPAFPKLPFSDNPAQDNRVVVDAARNLETHEAPIPFMLAMFRQESGLKHYYVPRRRDEDNFIVVGLDRNRRGKRHVITSRGYGLGQYTLFHHPPRAEEVERYLLDPERNLSAALSEFREKFDHFVNGRTSGTRADDRQIEFGSGSLRLCRYDNNDQRYLKDCRNCADEAGSTDIISGTTRVYDGSSTTYGPTKYYRSANYSNVPIRANFPCDWPYAARRYNGGGLNSYHYQTRILINLLNH